MNNKENIEKLESALARLEETKNVVYFVVYDTKNNARSSVKHIYDLALTLHNDGRLVKLLVEDQNYSGVESWLGTKYKEIPIVSIKDEKIDVGIDDVIVVPEYYSNVLEQLKNIKCVKIMLVQQIEYIFETLPVGSRWTDFGFERTITTTEGCKNYIMDMFPEQLVHIIPPIIDDIFEPSTKPKKPYIAISCRDRVKSRKFISEFYLKYPQLRWITFRDMIQMSYQEFADALKECMVSLWVDDESTFGTFPLESMKCDVPIVGKIPNTEPDWLTENGMWTYDERKIVDILGTFILAYIDGVELTDEVKNKMKETLIPYERTITEKNIISIFNSINNKRIDNIKSFLNKIKKEELV